MNLLQWSPKINARHVGTDYVIEPAMGFVGTLRCPSCGHTEKIESSGHLLGGICFSLPMNIDWEFDDLTKARECTNCGVVSAVPSKERDKLQREATTLVTLEWVEQQIHNLKKPAKKVA